MNPMPELAPMLKQLRLSGILDYLGDRNREAIESKLSHIDFLALLVQDEVARREQKKYQLRYRRAGFHSEKTIENFDFAFNASIDKAHVLELASCRFMEEKTCVLISGPCGTGKSHVAQALGHSAVKKGHDVVFISLARLCQQLFAARATNSYEKKLMYYARVPLLIIDDFGLKPLKSPHDEDLHDLVAERYERAATILTSNLAFEEWGEAFPNRLLGAATLDRLRHGAHMLTLNGKSYRSERSAPEKNKGAIAKGVKKA